MVCSSCDKPKAAIHARKSRLIPNYPIYLCDDCIKNKYEPRYVIILAGRQPGGPSQDVINYIVDKRYLGKEILGKEVFVKK